MNWKTVVPLVVALGLGTVAAVVGRQMLVKGRQAAAPVAGQAKVVVATVDLVPGATIRETDVGVREMAAGGLPAELIFAEARDVVGRVVTTPVMKDQAVMSTLLAPKGAAGGLQAMVPAGMRAVTMEVNEFSGVGGLLAPGARVDVVQTIQGKAETDPVARTIVENLKVLAVGRRMTSVTTAAGTETESNMPKSVTLLASVEQAETLDLAAHFGTPRLVLRNGDDARATGGKGMTVAELRGEGGGKRGGGAMEALVGLFHGLPATRPVEAEKSEPVSEPVVAERPNYREVEVIRGGASTSVKVTVRGERRDVVGGGDQLDRVVPADR